MNHERMLSFQGDVKSLVPCTGDSYLIEHKTIAAALSPFCLGC